MLEKKYFKNPDKDMLIQGSVLPIYFNYHEQENFRGNAELLELWETDKFQERHPHNQRVYIRAEIPNTHGEGINQPQTIIWGWENWKVKFIDGNDKGFITSHKIAYYITTSSNYDSGYTKDSGL